MTTAKGAETHLNQRERNSAAFAAWFGSKMDDYDKRDELRES